jgi:DNA-binding response OmpR family regulator
MKKKIRVLIIDDEPRVADALKLILDDYGYDAVVALTGREGLEKAAERQFGVTITDNRLPDMSGLDVIDSLRKIDSQHLVIVITAYGTPEGNAELIAHGAAAVLSKPFLPSDILLLINAKLFDSPPGQSCGP